MDAKTFATHYDAVVTSPRMRALYGESGYFNVGYWVEGASDLVSACARMVDELAATVPRGAARILDVGCGLGAGTRRLAGRFPGALVVGVNVSQWQLEQARARGVTAVVADATRLAIASDTVDAVLAIESAEHFDTREDFLAESRRVLRPGGVVALADMLFHEGDAISEQMLLPHRRVRTISQYEDAMRHAGFTGVSVRDVTAASWTPFCAAMRPVFEGQEEALRGIERSLAHYVLAVGLR